MADHNGTVAPERTKENPFITKFPPFKCPKFGRLSTSAAVRAKAAGVDEAGLYELYSKAFARFTTMNEQKEVVRRNIDDPVAIKRARNFMRYLPKKEGADMMKMARRAKKLAKRKEMLAAKIAAEIKET